MIGQGRPIVWNLYVSAWALLRTLCLPHGIPVGLVAVMTMMAATAVAAEVDVRLRIAWGSGDAAKHRWVGRIACTDATLSDVQPLGIETDAPVAIQLIDNELIIKPREERGFDGCDVTVNGASQSVVRFELRSEQSGAPTIVEVPLMKLAREQVREPIDTLGSVLLVYRCPGDRFRLVPNRENLIFSPAEVWPLRINTDFAEELTAGPVTVEVVLRAIGSDAVLWQATQIINAQSPSPDQLAVDVTCPTAEGAYRLSLSASAEQSFATRFVPGQGLKPFATREIDLVVIDPAARLRTLADKWLPVLSIDPANPGWWQRLPTWAQVSRLTGKPPGTIGNVRLLARPSDPHGLVELAPSTNSHDPSWQSFALPIQDVGLPHLIEIVYPLAEEQRLGVSIVEPDAAGRVTSAVLESGLNVDEVIGAVPGQIGTHRIVFWPRTQSPQLLIVNRHETKSGVFGRITLARQDTSAEQSAPTVNPTNRLIAAYISKPVFAQNFGAAEVLDPASGMSVQSWSTFLDGAHRLTQHLKLSGYTGALVAVAADGSTLYPSKLLAPSPRYDTGLLAASGQDPIRKDVLEMLLRVCDREGMQIVPGLTLGSPLPRLEELSAKKPGIGWIDANGRQLAQTRQAQLSANYNLLNPRVQEEVTAVFEELLDRCSDHTSFKGIALQLDSNGYGILPGLEWGFDDATVAAFAAETGIEVPAAGERGIPARAAVLLEEHRIDWRAWRINRLTAFYRGLAERLLARRSDLRLLLTTESLFAEANLEQAVRRSVSQPTKLTELLADRGVDLERLASIPGVEITNARRISPPDRLQRRVTDLVINEAFDSGDLLVQGAGLAFHDITYSRLASFDQNSPFGTDRTHLVLAHLTTGAQGPLPAVDGANGSYIEGGEYLSPVIIQARDQKLRSLAQLPRELLETQNVHQHPIEISVSRTAHETFVLCANESPWPVSGKLDLEVPAEVTCQMLGQDNATPGRAGRLPRGKSSWPLSLAPGDFQIWRFSSTQLRVGDIRVAPDSSVRTYLAQKIEQIEARTGNLNIARDYAQLQNPDFELEDGEARIFGWQPRKGVNGAIEIDSAAAHSGQRALRLKSSDNVGVAAQSHLFPLPETGMLVITAHVRAAEFSDNATITMAVETDEAGQTYRRARAFKVDEEFRSQWKQCDFVVSDLPVGEADQVRIQFHVTGQADVLLDDVALCDLRFDDQRRSELVKRVFAAKTALEEEQYTDCLRLLNEYWPQYLVEYVPPLVREAPILAKQPNEPETKASSDEKAKGRLRNIIPRIWR